MAVSFSPNHLFAFFCEGMGSIYKLPGVVSQHLSGQRLPQKKDDKPSVPFWVSRASIQGHVLYQGTE